MKDWGHVNGHVFDGVLANNRLAAADREMSETCCKQVAKAGEAVHRSIEVGGLVHMNKRRSPIDRRWWKPVALTVCFLMIVFTDLLILAKASGVVTTNSDAAGNGMANAFRDGFVETGFYIVAALTLLFAAIPRTGVRIALTVLLLPATLFFLLLAS